MMVFVIGFTARNTRAHLKDTDLFNVFKTRMPKVGEATETTSVGLTASAEKLISANIAAPRTLCSLRRPSRMSVPGQPADGRPFQHPLLIPWYREPHGQHQGAPSLFLMTHYHGKQLLFYKAGHIHFHTTWSSVPSLSQE